MDKERIMQIIVNEPKVIREIMLTDAMLEIFWFIDDWNDQGTRSSDVSKEFSLTIPDASQRLIMLYKKGYLRRDKISAPSGGLECVYYTAFNS